MAERVIPLVDQRRQALRVFAPERHIAATGSLVDAMHRPLRDLRISVTDRCNFRCGYCMPKEVFDKQHRYLPRPEMLSFEEIARMAQVFASHGVRKIRLTGGEPLLRKDIELLVSRLTQVRTADGTPVELTLTTNGSLLARKAKALKAAGLSRVTVSLDGLDDAVFRRMNDVDFPVTQVLAGIDAARAAGLGPVKVNMVVRRGSNEHEIIPIARRFRYSGIALRFIEFMDVGATNRWRMDEVMPSSEVKRILESVWPLVPLEASAPGETARRWAYADGGGEVGFIGSVTQAFCGDCNRARLSTDGKLYLCLFADNGHDLRSLLRAGATDREITSAIAHIWQRRSDRYSQLRGSEAAAHAVGGTRRVEMSYIGG